MKSFLIAIVLMSVSSMSYASIYNVDVFAMPVAAVGILFATVLLVAGAFGRPKKKSKNSLMVGAFTRAS